MSTDTWISHEDTKARNSKDSSYLRDFVAKPGGPESSRRAPSRWALLSGALVLLATWVYGCGLAARAPAAGVGDIEDQAVKLLERGWRDVEGRPLPLFVHVDAERWLAPVPVYATAAVIRFVSSTPAPARLVAAACGVANVLLLFLLVARCCSNRGVGLAAALVLLFTPSHALFSRTAAPDGIWPLPFVLGWAVGLTALMDRPSQQARWTLAAGTAALAASAYTQPSSALMMPMFAGVTAVMFLRAREWRIRDGIPAAAMFATVLLPLVIWYLKYPATYPDTFGRWVVHPAHLRNPLAWLQALSNWGSLSTVAALFWGFLSPSHLFFSPDAPGRCGLFLTPLALPIAAGLYESMRPIPAKEVAGRSIRGAVVASFLIGPLAAAMFGHARSADRALIVVPFGLLIAAWGARELWRRDDRVGRGLVFVCAIAVAIQACFCLV
jgi:hypothetical protein